LLWLNPFFSNTSLWRLNKKTLKDLNSSAGGSFMHMTAEHAKDILMKIVDNLPEENEKLLEEET
jgi:hypothetical protein